MYNPMSLIHSRPSNPHLRTAAAQAPASSPVRAGWRQAPTLIALLALLWLPRALALDTFVTTDEPLWLGRAANFACALQRGDLEQTFQREHPGVTAMWAGAAGFWWRAPGYADGCTYFERRSEHEPALRERGLDPLQILAAGRTFMVLANILVLALAFLYARRLLGPLAAALGVALIALDPFHLAHSRLLHLDGLLSSLMLLSVLAFADFVRARPLPVARPLPALLVSAAAAGLAALTKSLGLFVAPFVGLLALVEMWRPARATPKQARAPAWRLAWPLAVWAIWAAAAFVLAWPAMWANPVRVLLRMFDLAGEYAAGGHGSPLFFNHTIVADGRLGARFWYFYPLTYLWRTTPLTLLGLAAGLVALARHGAPLDRAPARRTVQALLLFALLFALAITLSAKKFDRYLLPAYLPLDLVAGAGWAAIVRWLAGRLQRGGPRARSSRARFLPGLALFLVLAAQAAFVLPTFPYYLSYYNPLLGGSRKAPQVMAIGWGEGLDQAARTLNARPDVHELEVWAWYNSGCFSYFYAGQSLEIPNQPDWQEIDLQRILNADYAVIYDLHQRQRRVPEPLLSALAHLAPEYTTRINGLEYVRIYALSHDLRADPACQAVDALFGDPAGAPILLRGFRLAGGEAAPTFRAGDVIPLWLCWQAQETPGEALKVFVHVLDEGGALVAQHDAEPAAWQRPTTGWQPGQEVVDAHGIALPPDLPPGRYTLAVGMYRLSGQRLPVSRDGRPEGDMLLLAEITIAPPGEAPAE
jgi:hypothetical protein